MITMFDYDYEDSRMYIQQKTIEDKIIENERDKEYEAII